MLTNKFFSAKILVMDKKNARIYIQGIINSVERDVVAAIGAFNNHNAVNKNKIGFFAVPRMIFPEIDCLGCLYCGNLATSKNSVTFMRKYFSQVNILYKHISGFLYMTYRHGLMHQHEPKNVELKQQNFFWQISMNHPTFHLKFRQPYNHLVLDGSKFLSDFLESARIYLNDFEIDQGNVFLENFNKALGEMIKPNSESKMNKLGEKYSIQSDLNFLKKQI